MTQPASWQVESHDDLVTVTVRGTVDARSGPALQDSLSQCLRRRPRAVLVELSGATVTDAHAVEAFSTVATEARLWPGTPVLLCAPDTATAGLLTTKAEETPPLYARTADALRALASHDELISEDIRPVPGAARQARAIVTEACARWNVPHLTASATLVASELVTNAVVHAHTPVTFQIKMQPHYLYIAVFDGAAAEPEARSDHHADIPGGRGLHLVASAATTWGHQRQNGGKVVWACLATGRRTSADC
ncbi:ATP-binding protein [Actinoplanes sp. NPDC004185]